MAAEKEPKGDDRANKLKSLQTTMEKLDKTYGKGTVMRLSDTKIMDVPVISTGSLGLDLALDLEEPLLRASKEPKLLEKLRCC